MPRLSKPPAAENKFRKLSKVTQQQWSPASNFLDALLAAQQQGILPAPKPKLTAITFKKLAKLLPPEKQGIARNWSWGCACTACTEIQDWVKAHNYSCPDKYGYNPQEKPKPVKQPRPVFSWDEPTAKPTPKYRTQKARGVEALRKYSSFPGYGVLNLQTPYSYKVRVFPHKDDLYFPCFGRPCPTVPRHGFVESRVVSNEAQALALIAETLRADPQGEVIFMQRLSGQWSGIITHAGVCFGRSNDGATSGKSVANIPAYQEPAMFRATLGYELCNMATIKETPYVEFVEDGNHPVLVQLRDGPVVPKARNFIPREMMVMAVLTVDPTMSLLDWERAIELWSQIGTEGRVVYHPGGSLTSHFAVHAITHGIATIIDGPEPKIGDTLVPTGEEPEKLTATDCRYLAERLAARLNTSYGDISFERQRQIACSALATLHASPQWGRDKHLLDLRAEGIAATLIYTTAACLGEDRHWYGEGPGQEERARRVESRDGHNETVYEREQPACEIIYTLRKKGSLGRDQVYDTVMQQKAPELHRYINQAAQDLGASGWDSGYGGSGWADAAKETAKGFEVVERFIRKPTAKRWAKVMDAYNRIINTAHNNGNILNKWLGQNIMNDAAEAPGPLFLNAFTAEVATGLLKAPELGGLTLETVPITGRDSKQLELLPEEDDSADPMQEAA